MILRRPGASIPQVRTLGANCSDILLLRRLSLLTVGKRHAPIRFLRTLFEPTDWVAILLKSYDRSTVAHRVGPVSWVQTDRFQRWLRAMNAGKYNVFASVNAIALGRRARTRDAIGAVRHVFLDADHD